jgi:hypothetical protein
LLNVTNIALSDQVTSDRKKEYRHNIARVDKWVSTGLENGLFRVQRDVSYSDIWRILNSAQKCIELSHPPDFVSCDNLLNAAVEKYFSALQKTNLWWRLKNVYAFHLFIYLVLLLSVIFVLYNNFRIDNVISENHNIPTLAINAATWGVIGSVLRGFWALWTNINDRSYRSAWFIWFLSIPFIGGILGAMVYFIIIAGVIIASSENVTNGNSDSSLNPLVIIVLCAFAGFNWQWAIEQIEKLKNIGH